MKITENPSVVPVKEISYPAYFELKSPGSYKGMVVMAINAKWGMVVRAKNSKVKPVGYVSDNWWAFTDSKVWKNISASFTIEL